MKKVLSSVMFVIAMMLTFGMSAQTTISTFPWNEGFENQPTTWTMITANSAMGSFQIVQNNDRYTYSRTGSYCLAAPYSDTIDVDQWAVSPAIAIPANATDFQLSYYIHLTGWNGIESHYQVRVSTTTADTSAFTTILKEETDSTGEYVKRVISLVNYAGSTIYIAFRNITLADGDALFIDDLRIGEPTAPELSLQGPSSALMNDTLTYTATSDTNNYMWFVDGVADTTTGNVLTVVFTTAGQHVVVVGSTNIVGTSYDTINVNIFDCSQPISSLPYTESFEGSIACWTMVSADSSNDAAFGVYADAAAHSGDYTFRFSSYSRAANYNQYLISPRINLSSNYVFRFWYKSQNAGDVFRVLGSTTTNDTTAFTDTIAEITSPATAWSELGYLIGDSIKYIAINYYGNFAYYTFIDDATIDELSAPSVTVSGDNNIGTGMNAEYAATAMFAESLAWFVDGTLVANSNSATMTTVFTSAGQHQVVVKAINTIGENTDTILVDVFSCDGITLPYTPDFSNGLGCWFNESRATEGYGWFASVEAMSNPVGSLASWSASSSYFGVYDVNVDNWLFSPVIAMSDGSWELSWQIYAGGSPNYLGDHYAAYVISGTDTTMIFEETVTADDSVFNLRVASIPSNITGDFRVAFRHFDCQGGFAIAIDSVKIDRPIAPVVRINAPATAVAGTSVTITAVSYNTSSYAWTVDGNALNETTSVINYTFSTGGSHTVSVVATNGVGSTTASKNIDVVTCDPITEFPWEDGFEGSIDCWSFSTVDEQDGGFSIHTPFDYNGQHYDYTHNGTHCLFGDYSDDVNVDQWAVTPQIQLPADASNFEVSWFVFTNTYDDIPTQYEVRLSTSGADRDDFTELLHSETDSAQAYQYRTASLARYAGQTVRIAFRNITAVGGNSMMLDDVRVGVAQANAITTVGDVNVAVYPNPTAGVVNISGEGVRSVEVLDVNGRVVASRNGEGSIDISSYASGLYLVRTITDGGISTARIVKE